MSKTTVALVGIVILSVGILAAWSVPQAGDPAVLLRAAVEKEEVDGNLDAAIEQYKHIIKIAGAHRAVAAQALLRLGGCYEKRGPAEARKTYEQLIRDFGEQSREVAAARQRLAALAGSAPARSGESQLTIRLVPKLDMYAKPSPDGRHLAFVDWSSSNLALLDVATGSARNVTRDGLLGETRQIAQFAAWSRDSSRIALEWMVAGPKENREELRILSISGDTPPEVVTIPGATWIMPRDWSPDGTRVLCEYGLVGGGRTAAVITVADRSVSKLQLPPRPWVEHRFTDDGNGILYSAPADGKSDASDIFLHDLKTGTATPVVQHPAEDLLVGVLPGTEWLLFASDRRGSLDLWAVRFRRGRADGEPVLVKQGLGRFYPLGLTNDGRYYYATLSATNDVLLADFDPATGKVTGEARKFTTRWDGVSMDPSFSPDGTSLAYVVKRRPNPLPVYTADSLVVQSLKEPKAAAIVVGFDDVGLTRVVEPCWSADGKAVILGGTKGLYRVDLPSLRKTLIYEPRDERRRISHECATDGPFVYVRATTAVLGQTTALPDAVIRIDLSGADQREVFRAPQGQRILSDIVAVSPDGRMLSVVTSLDRNRRLLMVMPSDGGTPRQVVEFRQPSVRGMAHTWVSDGRSILYVHGPENGTSSIRRVRIDGEATEPETVFQSNQALRGLRFQPSGRLLAFTGFPGSPSSSEVWTIESLREQLARLAAPPTRKAP